MPLIFIIIITTLTGPWLWALVGTTAHSLVLTELMFASEMLEAVVMLLAANTLSNWFFDEKSCQQNLCVLCSSVFPSHYLVITLHFFISLPATYEFARNVWQNGSNLIQHAISSIFVNSRANLVAHLKKNVDMNVLFTFLRWMHFSRLLTLFFSLIIEIALSLCSHFLPCSVLRVKVCWVESIGPF